MVKAEADKLAPQDPVHVQLRRAPDQFGAFVSNDQQGLTVYDLYLDHNVTLAYADVKTIGNGLGRYDSRTGKQKSHKKLIVIVVVVVAVGALSILEGGFRD